MFKVAIFDLDGTLTDTLESMAVAGNKTLEKVGLEPRSIDEYKYFAGDGADTLVRRMLVASGDTECKLFDKAYNLYRREFAVDCTYKVNPYDGIMDMIKALKEKGLKLAVLSNKPHARVMEVVYKFFEEGTFDVVQGQVDGVNKKPDPQGAITISKILGVDTTECIYVGDTDVDMKTGKSANMYTVGVLWGFREEEELRTNGADKIVSKPSEIVELV